MKKILLILILVSFTACQKMGASEYGVVFRKLPPSVGGGVGDQVLAPTSVKFLWPWESVYRIDTSVRSIEWGAKGDGTNPRDDDYVHTRARDGNEVALAVLIQYRVSDEPEKLVKLVREVGASDDEIENLVGVVARSDIRTFMSGLETDEFFRNEKKYEGERQILDGMQKRLAHYGIVVQNVNLKEHRFERQLPDGTIDQSYQEKINQVQAINEATKREELRKETILAEKQREYNDEKGEFDRSIAEANGYKNQAVFGGDAYFQAKKNDAEAILAAGQLEVKGIIEQVNALSGPGGAALLKLELAKSLLGSKSRFVLVEGGQGANSVAVQKIDTNQLMQQIGVFEGLKEKEAESKKTEAKEAP
jgi:SPFH domain / Band 7 family